MIDVVRNKPVLSVQVYVVEGYCAVEVAAVESCITVAGYLSHTGTITCRYISESGGMVRAADSQMWLSTEIADFSGQPGLLVVVGGPGTTVGANSLAAVFGKAQSKGWRSLILSESVVTLKRRGAFSDHKACVPWHNSIVHDVRNGPDVCTMQIFNTKGRVTTCVGRAATVHALLYVLAEDFETPFIHALAEHIHLGNIRSPRGYQRQLARDRFMVEDSRVVRMIEVFEKNFAEPISLSGTAHSLGMCTRQMERLSKRNLGRSPRAMLEQIRLKEAMWLLERTSIPIIEVAGKCGFASSSALSRSFRRHFGTTASSVRWCKGKQ